MMYIVTCLTDAGPDQERVQTSRRPRTRGEAQHYANTIDPSRKPELESLCVFCGVEYRTAVDPQLGFDDWPRCINCGAC